MSDSHCLCAEGCYGENNNKTVNVMPNSLLTKLAERYTLHTSPDVATTVEQGLVQLSSGIYTEEERFIFELLQNAVDSFDENSNEVLNISLRIQWFGKNRVMCL